MRFDILRNEMKYSRNCARYVSLHSEYLVQMNIACGAVGVDDGRFSGSDVVEVNLSFMDSVSCSIDAGLSVASWIALSDIARSRSNFNDRS